MAKKDQCSWSKLLVLELCLVECLNLSWSWNWRSICWTWKLNISWSACWLKANCSMVGKLRLWSFYLTWTDFLTFTQAQVLIHKGSFDNWARKAIWHHQQKYWETYKLMCIFEINIWKCCYTIMWWFKGMQIS